MENEEKIRKDIIQFLQGKLSERSAEKLLGLKEGSADVAAVWKEEELIYTTVNTSIQKEILSNIKKRGFDQKQTFVKKGRLFIYLLALLGFLGISFMYFYRSNTDTSELANQYYAANFSSEKSISGPGNGFDEVRKILSSRESGSYKIVEDVLVAVSDKSDNYGDAYYYLGHLYFKQDEYEKAVLAFNKSIGNESGQQAKILWYKALSLLAAKKVNEATIILKELERNSVYSSKATLLLSEM